MSTDWQAIIGAVGDLDGVLSPDQKGSAAMRSQPHAHAHAHAQAHTHTHPIFHTATHTYTHTQAHTHTHTHTHTDKHAHTRARARQCTRRRARCTPAVKVLSVWAFALLRRAIHTYDSNGLALNG